MIFIRLAAVYKCFIIGLNFVKHFELLFWTVLNLFNLHTIHTWWVMSVCTDAVDDLRERRHTKGKKRDNPKAVWRSSVATLNFKVFVKQILFTSHIFPDGDLGLEWLDCCSFVLEVYSLQNVFLMWPTEFVWVLLVQQEFLMIKISTLVHDHVGIVSVAVIKM